MTAHAPKALTITPELVAKFADYYARNQAWGAVHVSLDDGNYWCTCSDLDHADWTDEDREIARLHDLLTESQRRRLGQKARAAYLVRSR